MQSCQDFIANPNGLENKSQNPYVFRRYLSGLVILNYQSNNQVQIGQGIIFEVICAQKWHILNKFVAKFPLLNIFDPKYYLHYYQHNVENEQNGAQQFPNCCSLRFGEKFIKA